MRSLVLNYHRRMNKFSWNIINENLWLLWTGEINTEEFILDNWNKQWTTGLQP